MTVDVFVAAGSNVDAANNLSKALAGLKSAFPTLRVSPAYRNKAVGFEGDDFINLVVAFATDQPIEAVRTQLQAIESACGRPREAPKWAARSMDLDILLFGDEVRNEPGLVLPRPDLIKRPYMLKPMTDLAPNVIHPTLHRTMHELWQSFDGKDHEMTVMELG